MLQQQSESEEPSEQRREGDRPDRPKGPRKKNPKTRKKRRRGWVRIRDLKHPRIHRFLQERQFSEEVRIHRVPTLWKLVPPPPHNLEYFEVSLCMSGGSGLVLETSAVREVLS